MIRSIVIKDFTAFHELNLNCSKGINVFIGANSTGKTHILKLMYTLCAANKPIESRSGKDTARSIYSKLTGVFKPEGIIGSLCHNSAEKASIRAGFIFDKFIEFGFSSDMDKVLVIKNEEYEKYNLLPVFIPPKEMLSSFPGFSSLYLQRELTSDETYFDLCQALETPILKDGPDKLVKQILNEIKNACEGEFLLKQKQRFYYKRTKGRLLEAELAAEGFRKLGMLQRLLQNGRINPGDSGPLFWDEPEANLNPSLMKLVVNVLIELARNDQQIFLATHDYVTIKLLNLFGKGEDQIVFHSFYRDETGEIAVNSTSDYFRIHPNAISDTFADLYDLDLQRALKGTEDE